MVSIVFNTVCAWKRRQLATDLIVADDTCSSEAYSESTELEELWVEF